VYRIDSLSEQQWGASPDSLLCISLADQLSEDYRMQDIFGDEIYAYPRDDIPEIQLPAMNIYTTGFSRDGAYWYQDGDLNIDITLPVDITRREKADKINIISNGIMLLLNTGGLLESLRATSPGLTRLGYNMSVDYKRIYNLEQKDALVVPIVLKYRIDLKQYYDYLIDNGLDPSDPTKTIYTVLKSIKITENLIGT
jgi:hypothetical protein